MLYIFGPSNLLYIPIVSLKTCVGYRLTHKILSYHMVKGLRFAPINSLSRSVIAHPLTSCEQ